MEIMKNPKTYKQSEREQENTLNEPLVAYQATMVGLPLAVLTSMSVHDIERSKLSGQTLVDVQKQTSLSANAMAGVVGVSKSKYYDLIRLEKLGTKNIDALADFATLWQKGIDAFDGKKDYLNEWLEMRNENLGNMKPIELLNTRIGRRELENAFLRIEHSTYG